MTHDLFGTVTTDTLSYVEPDTSNVLVQNVEIMTVKPLRKSLINIKQGEL